MYCDTDTAQCADTCTRTCMYVYVRVYSILVRVIPLNVQHAAYDEESDTARTAATTSAGRTWRRGCEEGSSWRKET